MVSRMRVSGDNFHHLHLSYSVHTLGKHTANLATTTIAKRINILRTFAELTLIAIVDHARGSVACSDLAAQVVQVVR
jgi:nitrogen-specific signal transduction histidine kinase